MKLKKILIIICILIFLFGIIGSLYLILNPHSQKVNIIQNGKILYTIDLEKSENRIIEVEYKDSKNIIEIKNHKIFMADAECPDHICIKMGELKSGIPIVCLPNKLVIEFTETNEIDAEVK